VEATATLAANSPGTTTMSKRSGAVLVGPRGLHSGAGAMVGEASPSPGAEPSRPGNCRQVGYPLARAHRGGPQ
jgi:hypothetical protein